MLKLYWMISSYNKRPGLPCYPPNPEDIAYNGLYPDSLGYVADVLIISDCYIWPADNTSH
jgi:hypothetical protein